MQSECKNRNGRIYPRTILESQVQSYKSNYIDKKRALGELDHPQTCQVNLDRVSHNIIDLRFEGNDIIGKAKILDTPMGKIAKSLINEGIKLGVSSRGLGSIKESIVQNDFFLSAIDIVADPSAPSAFVNGIMEHKEWIWNNGMLEEVEIEKVKEEINKISLSKSDKEAKLYSLFNDVLRKV